MTIQVNMHGKDNWVGLVRADTDLEIEKQEGHVRRILLLKGVGVQGEYVSESKSCTLQYILVILL